MRLPRFSTLLFIAAFALVAAFFSVVVPRSHAGGYASAQASAGGYDAPLQALGDDCSSQGLGVCEVQEQVQVQAYVAPVQQQVVRQYVQPVQQIRVVQRVVQVPAYVQQQQVVQRQQVQYIQQQQFGVGYSSGVRAQAFAGGYGGGGGQTVILQQRGGGRGRGLLGLGAGGGRSKTVTRSRAKSVVKTR